MPMMPEDIAKTSEESHQKALFTWARMYAFSTDARLGHLTASANGMHTTKKQASSMKCAGMNKGFPDVELPVVTRNQYGLITAPGLYIEMKKAERRNHKNGGLDVEQVKWRDFLVAQGYVHAVCYTWEEARDVILQYLT